MPDLAEQAKFNPDVNPPVETKDEIAREIDDLDLPVKPSNSSEASQLPVVPEEKISTIVPEEAQEQTLSNMNELNAMISRIEQQGSKKKLEFSELEEVQDNHRAVKKLQNPELK